MRIRAMLYAALAVTVALALGCTSDEVLEIPFPPGIEGQDVQISLALPAGMMDSSALWEVIPPDCKRGKKAYAQPFLDRWGLEHGDTTRWKVTFLWDPATGSKGNTKYFIWRKSREEVAPLFSFQDDGAKTLTVLQEGKPVLSYVYGMNLKEGVAEDRTRSCYVHPLWGLDKEVLTDDFPEDHPHHRGVFWTWPEILVGDSPDTLSLWDIRGIQQRFESWFEPPKAGPTFASFGAQNGWYAGEKRVMDEQVRLTVFRAGDFGRIIDFEFRWTALDQPVKEIGAPEEDKGYGGFGLRMAPCADPVITTDSGLQAEDSNRQPFQWADFSARFGQSEKASGAAIFPDPANPGYPNGWTLRHYGFTGVAWPGLEPFTFQPGVPVTMRYRVWVHRGDVDWGRVASTGKIFLTPIQARILQEAPPGALESQKPNPERSREGK